MFNSRKKSRKNKEKPNKKILAWMKVNIALLIMLVFAVSFVLGTHTDTTTKVSTDKFLEMLNNQEIEVIYADTVGKRLRFALYTDETRSLSEKEREKIKYNLNDLYETDLLTLKADDVSKCGTRIVYKSFSSGATTLILANAAPIVLNLALFIFLFYMFNKQFNFKTNASNLVKEDKDVKFEDVIGQDEVISDIKSLIEVMKNKDKYKDVDLRIPKGVLLIGPPGTGKTMIAKAMATEAGMKFFAVNSSSMIDRFVGMGAKNVRETFAEARKNTPCIVFFDEIDAIGTARESGGYNQEGRQTINALLQELDGFSNSDNILVVAATNCYEQLDKALVRAGRFDRKIVISPPKDADTRLRLLEHYLGNLNNDDLNLMAIAKQLQGFTGADIDQICNEAKLIMVQKGLSQLYQDTIEEAIDKTLFNGNRTRNKYETDLNIVAHHECGHALSLLLNNKPVARISIIPNTSGVGGMVVSEDEDTLFTTKSDIKAQVKSMYSGRIAEELIFGADNITSGASNDLEKANILLDRYIKNFAFDKYYGLIPLDDKTSGQRKSEIAKSLYEEAYKELSDNLDILKELAKKILEEETMDGDQLKSFYISIKNKNQEDDSKKDSESKDIA